MYSSRATALTPQLPCRSTGPWFRHMVHHPGSETTVTDDDQSSKHNQYTTRRDNRSWLDLSLEIPTLLLGRAAVAGHICSSVQASFSGAADICGTARRVAKHYRGWAARGHSIEIQRHVQGEGGGYRYRYPSLAQAQVPRLPSRMKTLFGVHAQVSFCLIWLNIKKSANFWQVSPIWARALAHGPIFYVFSLFSPGKSLE